jgi:hypothetical protein
MPKPIRKMPPQILRHRCLAFDIFHFAFCLKLLENVQKVFCLYSRYRGIVAIPLELTSALRAFIPI